MSKSNRPSCLPKAYSADAEFKGYEEVVVPSRRCPEFIEGCCAQDILLRSDNVLFRKEKYYAVSTE